MAVLEADLEPFPDAIVGGQRGRPEPQHASEARARPVGVLEVLLSERGPDLRGPVVGTVERPSPPGGIRIPTRAQAGQEGLVVFIPIRRLESEGGTTEPGIGEDEVEDVARVRVLMVLLGAGEPAQDAAEAIGQLDGDLSRDGGGRVVVGGGVRARHHADPDREPAQERVAREATRHRRRPREGVEVTAGPVQVQRPLGVLVAEQAHELAPAHRQPAAERHARADIRLEDVELRGVPERELIVPATEHAQRVVLLRVEAGRERHAEAERMRLGWISLQAERGGIEGEALVVVVQTELVGAATTGAGSVEHIAALHIGEGTDVSRPLGKALLPRLRGTCGERAGGLSARPLRPQREPENEGQAKNGRPHLRPL